MQPTPSTPTAPGWPAGGTPTAYSRRFELLQLVRSQGRLEVAAASRLLRVSQETVRRDLRQLESQGLIERSYGSARPIESGAFESSLAARADIAPEEKMRIAAAAARQLGQARTVFIDGGFTTQLIAQRMPEDDHFTVVTPSLPIASILAARPNVQVMMLGGRVRGNTLGVVDQWAVDMLSRLTIDLAIVGANGVSLDRGLTTPDHSVGLVKSAAIKASVRRIFIGAHHKFGKATFVRFAEVGDFELMITGHELSASHSRALLDGGVNLLKV